ncbi:hypothetical protein HmCmsJML149_00924 [Escherichia coli]|nr:hypothetical protein HmCmsJML149_00924 [Escherichia coli]
MVKNIPMFAHNLEKNFLVMTKAVSLFISLFGRTLIQIIAMEYLITSIWENLKIGVKGVIKFSSMRSGQAQLYLDDIMHRIILYVMTQKL